MGVPLFLTARPLLSLLCAGAQLSSLALRVGSCARAPGGDGHWSQAWGLRGVVVPACVLPGRNATKAGWAVPVRPLDGPRYRAACTEEEQQKINEKTIQNHQK